MEYCQKRSRLFPRSKHCSSYPRSPMESDKQDCCCWAARPCKYFETKSMSSSTRRTSCSLSLPTRCAQPLSTAQCGCCWRQCVQSRRRRSSGSTVQQSRNRSSYIPGFEAWKLSTCRTGSEQHSGMDRLLHGIHSLVWW